jgi:hypothetical protein
MCTTLYADLREYLLTDEEYLFTKNSLTTEIQELQQRLAELKAQDDENTVSMSQFSHWMKLIQKYSDVQELSKELIEAFVQEIRLHEGKEIEITLNYMDEFNEASRIYQERGKEVA